MAQPKVESSAGVVLSRALIDSLDEAALAALAERLAPLLAEELGRAGEAPEWMDTKGAARYLGLSVHALHRLAAARRIPFAQDAPRCRAWFRRSELDAWRGAGRRGPR